MEAGPSKRITPSGSAMQGIICKVMQEKKFGFITPLNSLPEPFPQKDVFFHFSKVQGPLVNEKDHVIFHLNSDVHDNDKPEAKMVIKAGFQPRNLEENPLSGDLSHRQPRDASKDAKYRKSPREKSVGRKAMATTLVPRANQHKLDTATATSRETTQVDMVGENKEDSRQSQNVSKNANIRRRLREKSLGRKATSTELVPVVNEVKFDENTTNSEGTTLVDLAGEKKDGWQTISPHRNKNPNTRVKNLKSSINAPCEGRIVSILEDAFFIKPSCHLPEGYNEKDVYCKLNKIETAGLPIEKYDEVEFTLGTHNREKPMAIQVKVTHFQPRKPNIMENYISSVIAALKAGQIGKKCEFSCNIVGLLGCSPLWQCMGDCSELSDKGVLLVIDLVLLLGKITKGLRQNFCNCLTVLYKSHFFESWNGRLKKYIERFPKCLCEDEDIQGFLLLIIHHLPERARGLTNILKNVVSDKVNTRENLLFRLLKQVGNDLNTNVEDMEWEELPLVPSIPELFESLEGRMYNLQPVKEIGPYKDVHEYLDVYFRLLRADCFSSLQKGISDFLKGKLDPRDMKIYHSVILIGTMVIESETGLSLALQIKPQEENINWMSSSNLMFGNLLCISPTGTFRDIIWATVVNRDPDMLKKHIIMVELRSECNTVSDAEALLLLNQWSGTTLIAESPTYYRAFHPILKAIQSMDPQNLPFQEEIVEAKSSIKPAFFNGGTIINPLPVTTKLGSSCNVIEFLTSDFKGSTTFDSSQLQAIRQALRQRVAIIQGPPGTGKTFIGIRLLQLILSESTFPNSPVLVLTYKNHALDEFLKDVAELYPDEVVRVGGRSQEPELEKCSLKTIRKEHKRDDLIVQQLKDVRNEIYVLKGELENAIRSIINSRYLKQENLLNSLQDLQIRHFLIGCDWDKVDHTFEKKMEDNKLTEVYVDRNFVKKYLSIIKKDLSQYLCQDSFLFSLFQEAYQQWLPSAQKFKSMEKEASMFLNTSASISTGKVQKERETYDQDDVFDEKDIEDEQRERMASGSFQDRRLKIDDLILFENKNFERGKLFSCAKQILSQIPIALLRNVEDLWTLDDAERVKLVQSILADDMEDVVASFKATLSRYQEACSRKTELENQHSIQAVLSKKVIGMTITGAGIYQNLLSGVKPAVIIVEEAAEILEPQLIACLGDWAQQLILIGDHKQLRPSVESYTLQKDYYFDISLMERLINNKYPYSTLTMQNRMRPEFAELLLDIYPDLTSNLERVGNNKPPAFMEMSLFFWDHRDEEKQGRSFSNEEEAEKAIQLALFMIQQGHSPNKITILGAYQAQVSMMRKKIRAAENQYPKLFSSEVPDCKSFSDDGEKNTSKMDNKIKIHTVDLYQGDENDIVIVSLVRSNKEGRLGFLKMENRRCVAQSRAKCGLYFIGNAETLSSSSTWSSMLSHMRTNGNVGSTLVLQCPVHKEKSQIHAARSSDIHLGSFCKVICQKVMPCRKHLCGQPCQPPHSHKVCNGKVWHKFESCSHEIKLKCSQDKTEVKCEETVEFVFSKCGHRGTRVCHQSEEEVICQHPCPRKFPDCKHVCGQICGKTCDPKSCEECVRIQKMEAIRREQQEMRMILLEKKKAEKELEELKKKPMNEDVVRKELSPTGDTASEYLDVEDRVKKYIHPGHKWFPVVTKIELVSNELLWRKWLEVKKKMKDPRRSELKFHGTSAEAIEKIISGGFKMPQKAGMYGKGIYFATDSSKSAQDIYTKGSNMLLLCDVLLGRTKTVECAMKDMTLQKLKSSDYDSLFAKRETRGTGGVLNDEFVVYRTEQALPKYIIHYNKASSQETDLQLDKLDQTFMSGQQHVCLTLKPSRHVNLNDPHDLHFRIAESQFLRLMQNIGGNCQLESVEYHFNPILLKKFKNKQSQMKMADPTKADYILAFHGTKIDNIQKIVKENFRLDKLGSHTNNRGYYGAGIYFSEFPNVSMGYGQLLLCKVLPGKSYECRSLMIGASLEPGHDSHSYGSDSDKRAKELVIFNPDQILPCYVLNIK